MEDFQMCLLGIGCIIGFVIYKSGVLLSREEKLYKLKKELIKYDVHEKECRDKLDNLLEKSTNPEEYANENMRLKYETEI
jgi:hypothetical protein